MISPDAMRKIGANWSEIRDDQAGRDQWLQTAEICERLNSLIGLLGTIEELGVEILAKLLDGEER